MSLSLSHWYPGSGVVLDCIIPDLCTLTYFYTVKPVLSGHSKTRPKNVFKTNCRMMHSTIIKLPFVLSIFEWPLNTVLLFVVLFEV